MELKVTEKSYYCPYCGEQVSLVVDLSDDHQDYIEDCEVCCRPINFTVEVNSLGDVDLIAKRDDE